VRTSEKIDQVHLILAYLLGSRALATTFGHILPREFLVEHLKLEQVVPTMRARNVYGSPWRKSPQRSFVKSSGSAG
jgi:hypothetical protein